MEEGGVQYRGFFQPFLQFQYPKANTLDIFIVKLNLMKLQKARL